MLSLIPALAEIGISSTLVCIDNPHQDEQVLYQHARASGLPAQRLPCKGRLDGATIRALANLLRQHPDAILHVHGYKSAYYALRARRSHPATPVMSTLHGWVTNTRALWLYRMLELWMLRRIQRVCIVSEAMRGPLHDAGIPPERIRFIANGIDTTRFRPGRDGLSRAELGIPDDAFVFGGVMRLSQEKNPLGLLDAFVRIATEFPEAWLVIAGDGPERATFERLARESGIVSRVRLLGARNDTERVYPLLDCFVLPSHSEGLPLALLEAMACERPVIATRVGQVASVLEDLPAALVAPGDGRALGHAMRTAIATRGSLPEMRRRVEARYSVARVAHDYAVVYRELGVGHVSQAA